MKKPDLGARIRHDEPAFDRATEGIVVLHLAAQFVYQTDDGYERLCLYKEVWEEIVSEG